MAAIKIFGFTITKSNTEKEIKSLFEYHQKTLLDQKQKMSDDITEWGDALMQSIFKNVNRQKYYLEKEYTKQVKYLSETYDEFIEELHVREQIDNTEEINQLLEQYKALEYKLAALETTFQTIPFIQLPSTKQSVIKNRDEFDATESSRMSQSDNGSTEEFYDILDNSVNTDLTTFSNLSYTRTKKINGRSFSITSENENKHSINNNEDQQPSAVKDDGLAKKCPVCFMIFPLAMTGNDRSQHIVEHDVGD